MRGRRKPTSQHKKDGTFQASRHARRVDNEPAGGPVGEPPTWMRDDGQGLWRDVVAMLADDVLQKLDSAALGEMCDWYADLQEIKRDMRDHKPTDEAYYRLNQMKAIASKHFRDYLTRFGMTPSDRPKIKVAETERKEENPFKVLDAMTG